MKILLLVFALWAFMYIAPSDGKQVRRYHGNCNKGEFWLIRIKCTNKCKIGKPKAIFRKKGKVSITGRVGEAFTQKKRSCGKNCFCMKRSKNRKNQVTCKRTKKINSNRVHFDIRCIKKTTKLRFQAYIKNIEPRMKRKCENKKYHDGTTCKDCTCYAEGSKFLTCEDNTGNCKCKDGYKDKNCKNCQPKFYKTLSRRQCLACNCDPVGSTGSTCADGSGNCNCKAGLKLPKCDKCLVRSKKLHEDGVCRKCENKKYHDGSTCQDCNCDLFANYKSCEDNTGKCFCKDNAEGNKCNTCKRRFYKDTSAKECKACNCGVGAKTSQCDDDTGNCQGGCRSGFKPPKCEDCQDGFYFNAGSSSCDPCGCTTANTKANKATCDQKTGQCDCVPGKSSRDCST